MSRWIGASCGIVTGLIALLVASAFVGKAEAADPRGVWLVDGEAAVELFQCNDSLCGRIVWLMEPRDRQGDVRHDARNPDPALRQRPLCGLDVLSGLKPVAPDSWDGGRFYNPQDGHRYSAGFRMGSDDRLVARFYVGMPILGESRTLTRISGPLQRREPACGAVSTQTASAGPALGQ